MAAILIGNWWALALRGIAAILFALICFFAPWATAAVLILLFGAYAFVDGVLALIAARREARQYGGSGALLIEGILNLLVAVVIFVWPAAAIIALVYLIAIWAIVSGVAMIAAGLALIRLVGELLLIVAGALSILLGIVLFLHPGVGVIALSWWLGIYALLFGMMMLSAAFRIRHRSI